MDDVESVTEKSPIGTVVAPLSTTDLDRDGKIQ